MFNTKALVFIVSCAVLAQAQSQSSSAALPTSTSGLDTCIVSCLTIASEATGCNGLTNISCACTSTSFQQAALGCLETNCTAADLQTVQTLQQEECGSSNTSTTASSTGSATSTSPSGTATSASSSATSSSGSSSGALVNAPMSFGTLIGTLVASAGALVGAAFVL